MCGWGQQAAGTIWGSKTIIFTNLISVNCSPVVAYLSSLTWPENEIMLCSQDGERDVRGCVINEYSTRVSAAPLNASVPHDTPMCCSVWRSCMINWMHFNLLKNDCPLIIFNSPESVHPGATGPNPRLSPRSLWHLTCLLHGDEFELRSKWITGKWSSAQVHCGRTNTTGSYFGV